MSESFDVELTEAFKQHEAESLDGWEFTPALQQRVLERIRQEEEGAVAAPARPARRPLYLQPFTWVAVAAAAFLIVINTGVPGLKGPSRSGSSSSAPMAAPKAESPAAPPAAAAPATTAPGSESQFRAANGTAQADSVAPKMMMAPSASGSAPAGAAAPVTFALTAPVGSAASAAPTPAPALAGPRTALARATTPTLLAAPAVAEVRELSAGAVKAIDSQGKVLWQTPVDGLTPQSPMAVSPDGHTAVALSNQVVVLEPTGDQQGTLALSAPAVHLAWSADGRLAVATSDTLSVYRGETRRSSIGLNVLDMAFSADGKLAALVGDGAKRGIWLFNDANEPSAQFNLASPGPLLGFSPDGNLVAAGSGVYSLSGQPVWQTPIQPDGAVSLPNSDLMLFWNGRTAAAVSTADGHAVWQAEYSGAGGLRQAAASAGGYFALAGSLDDGSAALWVLDRDGHQVYSERLAALPAGIGFAGDRLVLELDSGIQTRKIGP